METTKSFDVIVIGAGIQGLSTAYNLAKFKEKKVLLLEQFPLPHSRGGSHGQSRVIRRAYVQPHIARMMEEALEMWQEIERESQKELMIKNGYLFTGPKILVDQVKMALNVNNFAFEVLNKCEMAEKYPQFRGYDQEFVYEKEAGFLKADKCLLTLQDLIRKHGGEVRDAEKVLSVTPVSDKQVFVQTHRGNTFAATSAVITCAAWTPQLIKPLGLNLPLRCLRQTVMYWKDKTEAGHFVPEKFPCFAEYPDKSELGLIYAVPDYEYPGYVKFCLHGGDHDVDPDKRDIDQDYKKDIQYVTNYMQKHIPFAEATPAIIERCQYMITPDDNFVIDKHPKFENIVIGVSAGHGFKIGPVFGKCLAELSLGETPSHDISHFSIRRFTGNIAATL